MSEEKKWLGSEPTHCDLCGEAFTEVFIDGKTIHGPWGLLCSACHEGFWCWPRYWAGSKV